jgi:hypothetical protein
MVLPGQVSEADGEFSERGSQPVPRIGFGDDVVMAAAEVLHEFEAIQAATALLPYCGEAYRRGGDQLRRDHNQAWFD